MEDAGRQYRLKLALFLRQIFSRVRGLVPHHLIEGKYTRLKRNVST
jgi:hypothetical protein